MNKQHLPGRSSLSSVAALVVLAAAFAPSITAAQAPARRDLAVLSGTAVVPRGQTLDALIVFQGPTQIDGTVTGDLLALGGDVQIAGSVGGSVTALGGGVHLMPGSSVGGDVAAARAPVVDPGARIGGQVRPLVTHVPLGLQVLGRLTTWLAMTLSLFALALLLALAVPRGTAEATYAAASSAPATSLGLGIAVAIALPVLAVLAIAAVLGAPFGAALLLAIAPLAACGYVASAWILGRWIAERGGAASKWSSLALLFVGLTIVRAVALLPVVHVVLWVLLPIFGLGAACTAVWRARTAARPAAADAVGAVTAPAPVVP